MERASDCSGANHSVGIQGCCMMLPWCPYTTVSVSGNAPPPSNSGRCRFIVCGDPLLQTSSWSLLCKASFHLKNRCGLLPSYKMYNVQMKEKMVRIDLSTFTKLIQIYLSYPFLLKNQLNSSFSLDTGPCSNLGHGQCHCSKAHFSHSTILVGA